MDASQQRRDRGSFERDHNQHKRSSFDKGASSSRDDRRTSVTAAGVELNFIFAAQHEKLKEVQRYVLELKGDVNGGINLHPTPLLIPKPYSITTILPNPPQFILSSHHPDPPLTQSLPTLQYQINKPIIDPI